MIIHLLEEGSTPCGMDGTPSQWPRDQTWLPKDAFFGPTDAWQKLNPNSRLCPKCVGDPALSIWPQQLKIYVHDQKDECESMQKWLQDRGIDPRSEPGRRIANAAYEHEMIYEVHEDGRTVLLVVDGRAVEDPA